MSTCKVKPNSIRDLKREGAVSNDMEILDVEKFDSLNIQYTDLARVKYNMSSPGLLFDKRIKTATAMTDETGAQKYYAVANAPLFDELQRNFESGMEPLAEEEIDMSSPKVRMALKSVNALQSDKAIQLFNVLTKNKVTGDAFWNKVQSDLQIPKEQMELLKQYNTTNREELIANMLGDYSFTVEINIAKDTTEEYGLSRDNFYTDFKQYTKNGKYYISYLEQNDVTGEYEKIEKEVSKSEYEKYELPNTQYYFSLTVPGGTNYTENEIATPAIAPIIQGHAQFATANGIGWFRSDEQIDTKTGSKTVTEYRIGTTEDVIAGLIGPEEVGKDVKITKNYELGTTESKTRRILEVQSDLFQKGRDKEDLTQQSSKTQYGYSFKYNDFEYEYDEVYKNFAKRKIGDVQFEYISIEEFVKAVEDSGFKVGGSKENQFLQILNKDNNWVTFFVKSIIQDSAKKGYEKVLFPSGDTASKVEGHTTLEEFKKQKEDRIKKLEKNLENTPKMGDKEIGQVYYSSDIGGGWFFNNDKIDILKAQELLQKSNPNKKVEIYDRITGEKWNKDKNYFPYYNLLKIDGKEYTGFLKGKNVEFDNPNVPNPKYKEINDEITQLKQELERVEKEGFAALRPIYNFYETTVANILKKQGYSPKVVTDEYGNTWNEIVIEPKREALPVLLQIKGDTESSKASPQVVSLMKDFLRRIGVDVKKLENINIDGVSTDVNGAALVMQKLILVAEGKEDVALSEEAMHFAVEIIEQTDPALFNKLMKEINSYRMLDAVIREYGQMKDYQTKDGKPDIRKLKKEAIAKVLVETIIKRSQGSTEKPELLEKTESWWQSIINALKRLFSSSGFDEAAMKVLKGEAIGTVDDIRANPDTIYYQQNLTPQQKVVNKIKDVHGKMSKPTTENGKYTIDGREIKNRVSDISKTWYENRFADKDLTKDEYDKAVDDLLKEKGTLLHGKNEVILKNHLLDENGQYIKDRNKRKDDSYYISQLSVSDAKFYEMLKLSMEKRLESFPEGTVFLAETMVYDPKRDLAGTIDFIAVEPSGKTHLLDWKFVRISNVEQQSDIPWYKVGAWRKQMGNYKNILRFAYDIKFDGTEQTRMVPFRAVYTRGNKKENIKPELINLEIGDVDLTNEERAYLLPVGLEDELTGDRRIDDLISKLNSVYDMLSSAKVSVDEKRNKAEQLNELYKAIRQLKTRKNFIPLITQAGILNKDIRKVIDEYYTKWDGKPLTSFSRAERNEFSRRILQYENSLKVYTTLYKNLKNVFVGDLTEREQKLKDQLKEVTETANDLEIDLEDVRKGFAENVIAKSENILDYLLPEKVITGFSSWFGTTSILQNKSTQVLYKMANRAFGFASMETVEQGNILKGIKERYDKWATSKGLTSKNYFSYIKKKDSNYLIDEYEKEFYIDLKKNTKDKNHQWVIDNIDVDAYKEFLKNKKEEEYERAKNKTRFGDEETINRQIAADIKNIDSLFDTSTDKSNGWLLYDYARKFPKEKWKTAEWVELHRKDGSGQYVNAPALEFYEYIRERNEKYETIGYINGKQTRNFLPFVRKSLMEKIVMGGDWRVGENLLRQITVSEGDVGYGQLDPIEKTPIYSIPKYFTRDTGEETSEDLFKNMTLLNEMAIRYEYLNEIESQMNLLIRTESNKEAIKTSFFGKTMVKPDGSIELTSDNSKNTQLVRDMTEAIIYGHKFVENENFDQLLIGLGNFGKRANEKLGRKIFPESFDNSRISLNKSAMWINNVFQLKALGLNPLSAISTLFGGSFQSIINAGVYFTKSDFVRNEFTLVQRMHGVDAKKYVGALQYFLPLTENYNNIIAKDLSLNRLDEGALQENLMILMRKADQYVQSVNFFSYLDNTIVENGELLNVREYLRKTPEYSALYSTTGEQRTSLEKKFEEDVKKLIAEKGVMNVAKIEGDKFVIPGVEQKSETVISLRRKVQSITKDALGNLSEDDLRRINLNIYGKSFMVFKNWIPRLVDVRFGNLKYNVASDAYEWGRTRMVFRLLTEDIVKSANSLKNSMFFGDNTAWIEQMRSLYEKKKNDYERDTGKPLRMTEEEFFQLATMNVRNQATDLLFYLALYGLLVLVKSLDDDEEDRAMRNRYRYMARMVDKITDEVAYFYNPAQLLKLTKSGIFPSVGLVENWVKTVENFGKEMYAIGVGDEELEKKNYVIKYFMKGLPITSALFDTVLLLFYPDLAKDLGMRAQSEARPIGF
jgi:hypothetical protein